MTPLTKQQIQQFEDLGYVLVSGLIPEAISAEAEVATWSALGISPGNPDGWSAAPRSVGLRDRAITATFTETVRAAVGQISGDDLTSIALPGTAFTINVFPDGAPWRGQAPHIDHAIQTDGFRVFPPPMRMASLTYLIDVEEYGAPTVVWPGSHKKIEALALSDTAKYELMWALNRDLHMLDLGDGLRVPGARGDVLFYHYLLAHSGSSNAGTTPRFAIAHKW